MPDIATYKSPKGRMTFLHSEGAGFYEKLFEKNAISTVASHLLNDIDRIPPEKFFQCITRTMKEEKGNGG